MRSRAFAYVLAVVVCFPALAQVSPFTGRSVVAPDSTGAYRLIIGGHFHGSSTNASGYPAATLLASIDMLNATNANMLLSTGDLFLRPDRDSARYVASLFSKLQLPLFNAPGNHDLEGKAYRSSDITPQMVSMGNDRILLFDTERDNSDIKGDQLALLESAAAAAEAGELEHLFIISHRPVWAEQESRYGDLFKGNTRALIGNNFNTDVLPVLRRIARTAEVFWCSGSMAGRAPASIFFQPHEQNITFIQSAIRDELRDAVLVLDVRNDALRWSALSLTGEMMGPVEQYDAAWWKAHQGSTEPFHWRRIPYLIKKNVTAIVYWYGFGTALLVLLLIWLWLKRIRRS